MGLRGLCIGMMGALTIGMATPVFAAEVKASYLYNLSDFTGSKPFSSAKITLAPVKHEIYAMAGESVSVFNKSGMEVYRFDYDPGMGVVVDVAVDESGDIIVLAQQGAKFRLVRCNFRAEPVASIELKGLPEGFASFAPNRMLLRDGRLYLVSMAGMQVLVASPDGSVIKGYDLAQSLEFSEKERVNSGLAGFEVDRDGSFLFTVPAIARAYRLSGDGTIKAVGKRGSAPGRFGVISGIAADTAGNVLVADTLRCVVLVFDKEFRFIKEFGARGFKPGYLIGPSDIAVDTENRVYVSQLRKRGVSVFQLSLS